MCNGSLVAHQVYSDDKQSIEEHELTEKTAKATKTDIKVRELYRATETLLPVFGESQLL